MRMIRAGRRASALCALLAAGALVLTGCAHEVSTLESGRSVRAELKAVQRVAKEGASTSEGEVEPHSHLPGEASVLNNGAVTWIMPTQLRGWKQTPTSEAGVTQLVSDTGCRYAASQHRIKPNVNGTDLSETEQQVQQWIAFHENNHLSSVSEVNLSTEIGGLGIGPVEMMRVDTDFISADGVGHHSTAWLRVFATASTPMFTTLNYSCPQPSYSPGELRQLNGGTVVANVEKPFMN